MLPPFGLGVPATVSTDSYGFQHLCRQLQAGLVVVGVMFTALPLYVIDSDSQFEITIIDSEQAAKPLKPLHPNA